MRLFWLLGLFDLNIIHRKYIENKTKIIVLAHFYAKWYFRCLPICLLFLDEALFKRLSFLSFLSSLSFVSSFSFLSSFSSLSFLSSFSFLFFLPFLFSPPVCFLFIFLFPSVFFSVAIALHQAWISLPVFHSLSGFAAIPLISLIQNPKLFRSFSRYSLSSPSSWLHCSN